MDIFVVILIEICIVLFFAYIIKTTYDKYKQAEKKEDEEFKEYVNLIKETKEELQNIRTQMVIKNKQLKKFLNCSHNPVQNNKDEK